MKKWQPNYCVKDPGKVQAIQVQIGLRSNLKEIRALGFRVRLEKRSNMLYSRRSRIWVKRGNGSETFAFSGDWLLRYKDGGYGAITDSNFRKTYKKLDS